MTFHSPTITSKTGRAIEARALLDNPGRSGRKARRTLIRMVMEKGMQCEYCHTGLVFAWMPGASKKDDNIATYDHRKTKKEGGPKNMKNGILSCRLCNELRGHSTVQKYKSQLNSYGSPQAMRIAVRARTKHNREARAAGNKDFRLKGSRVLRCPFLRLSALFHTWVTQTSSFLFHSGITF